MMLRRVATGACLATAILLAGCGTPYHKQVRNEANERFELVRAQMAFDQAEQSFATGQFDKAMNSINVAIARYPERAEYHVLKGRIFLETARLELAMRSLEEAMEIDEENAEAHYYAGIVHQRWSDHESAATAYRQAFDIDSENVQYLLATAEAMIAAGQYEDARHLVLPKMAHFEHNVALRQLLAQIALLQDKPAEAAKLFAEARLLDPEDTMLLEELARAQFAAKQYDEAHYSVKQLQDIVTDERPDLMHLEARCLTMMHRTSDARSVYLRLSQIRPTDVSIWIELGNVAYEVGDYRRVAICAERAIALAPQRFEGYILKGLFEQHSGNDQAAIRLFRKAADLAPNEAWPHMLLGVLLEDQGRPDEALLAYGAALRAEPENTNAQRLFSRLDGAAVASEPGDGQQP